MDKQQILDRITVILQESFGIAGERVLPAARLGEDLDIDSIDAVDLIVQLKPLLGGNMRPEAFRTVRTVADVVDAVHGMMHATADAPTGA